MAETSPISHTEQIAQANVRADEQLTSIKALVRHDEETRLEMTCFTPLDLCYEASLGDNKVITSISKDPDNPEAIEHSAINPFTFDELNATHKSVGEVAIELRNKKSQRVARFTLYETSVDWAGEPKDVGDIANLKFKAVDPETVAA
jgi:hypothetical protein